MIKTDVKKVYEMIGLGRPVLYCKVPERKLKEKSFQPFFAIKPTGQGTGLGLSLSYDIVKAHGGELKVDTRENEGTEFIIILPI